MVNAVCELTLTVLYENKVDADLWDCWEGPAGNACVNDINLKSVHVNVCTCMTLNEWVHSVTLYVLHVRVDCMLQIVYDSFFSN